MKQNYNLLTRSTALAHAWNTFFLKSKTKTASLLVVLFTLFGFSDTFGQVTINTASGSINSCTYPTSYVALGDIFLEENNNGNFGFALNNTDYTFIITAPANFEFQAGVGSVAFRAGEDITAASINVTATTITVTYRSNQANRTNADDRLTISGINFRGITGPSTGNMTRTLLGGGTGVINGAGTGSIYGTLTSTNNPPPANGGGAASVCVGSATPAFTNATGGGTWSIIPGTGTATVTVGGVVTGTSAGTVTVRYTVNGCIANSALTVNPTPAAIGGGAATVCTGASTPAFTNAVGGGTWSVISGTGTASITGGGVLTGTTAGTVTVRYTLPAGCFVNSAVVTIQQTPGAIAGGSATVCNGASTPAFTNPNGGGTWSVLNGTGTATITGGGVLTGTSPGTVTVRYTIGTCTPATFNVTVVAPPAAIGGGAITVCTGANTPAFTNATGGGTWSIINGTGSATINPATGVATGVTAGDVTVVYTVSGCSTTTSLTVTTVPVVVTGPTPTNAATGICYSGVGAISSISWGASAGATSYDVYFGAGSVPGTVTANVATNSYNTGALAASTTYFWRVVAKNACGDAVTSATFTFTTAAAPCVPSYCVPTFTSGVEPISNVTFNTINNTSANVCGAGSQYEDFSGTSTTVIKSSIYNLSVTGNTCGNFTNYIRAYVDWNIDGDFLDAGESFDLGTIVNSATGLATLPITIPAGATTGVARMRIMKRYNAYSTSACQTGAGYGQAEDYSLNIIEPANCAGMPLAGTATPATQTITTGTSTNISVVGYSTNLGITFQWQQATAPGGPYANVVGGSGATTATYTTPNLATPTYYMCVVTCTNSGLSANSTVAEVLVANQVLVSGLGTNNVNCGNNVILKDHAGDANYGNARDDWSALNVTSTAVVNISGTYDTENGADGIILYDGVGIGGIQLAVYTGAGTINYTGTPGQTITVRFVSNGSVTRPGFVLNVTYSGNCNIPCVAPTALPTALSLTATGTVISGAFTHAVPQPDNYLVVVSTNPVAPSPANGTSYAVGSTVGAGYTVVANGTNNSFSASGLLNSTTYYVYVFSFNRLCIGGPLYLGNLNGSITTTATDPYCIATSNVSTRYIENVFTVGAITNLNNMGTGRAPSGYADYTASTPVTQIPGGGVAIDYLLRVSRQFISMWVDWNNDGDFVDGGEAVYTSTAVQTIEGTGGFVVPPAQPLGTYRIRIRTHETVSAINPCTSPYPNGETEDYRLVVVADCLAKPVALYDGSRCDNGTVVLGVEGSAGVTEFRFYDSLYGGNLIGTQAAVPGITNWTTPFLTATTKYYVTAFNGSCESWYREEIIATVNPTANIIVTPSVPEVCGENNVVQIDAGGDEVIDYLVNEEFEGGLGTMVRFNVAGQANVDTQWTGRTSPYVPVGSVWKPAITSRAIGNGFALANSDFTAPNPKDTQLRTAVLDASAYSDLTLSFRHHFSYYPGEPVQFGYVDVSTDGGASWPTTLATYTSNQGFAGQFSTVNIDLSAFAGQPSLMVRFRYYLAGGSAWCNGWAIDDVQIYGTRPLNTTFTWTGGTVDAFIDPACTIPYVAQAVSTVYVRPTALQLASTSWSFTANATLGNGCPISEFIIINNKTKLWKGNVDNNWYNANNWEPVGVPDANTCVFIYPGTPAINTSNINTVANDGYAKTVTVRPSGVLTIHPGNDLTVTDNVTVDVGGTFNIENSGSLIQVNNLANSGNISMKRNVNIRKLDYVYWSSPVANYGLTNISTTSYRYRWIPTIGTNTNGWGNWSATSETMVLGKGYIVRGPNSYTTTLQNYTQNFVGVPNNGIINMPISRGTYDGGDYATGVSATLATRDDDNWNLIGNPYPSAVNANLFLATNTNIAGFIKYWTHGTLPSAVTSDPFYNNYVQNYTVGDYVTYNATGANPAIGNGNIAAGQGFFVLMNHSSAATTENVVFNNSMRRNDYRNDIFFRNANITNADNEEKHRIWLNLISPSATSSTTLIGYVSGASNEIDRMYDAPALGVKTNFELYSLSNLDKLNIQGKALPFNNEDQISLGINISQSGIHTIGISTVDGLFENNTQNIYLEDKTLGITHDLRSAPYSFTETTGRTENRFVLKFNNETLGNEDFTANAVTVYTNEFININATNQTIKSVKVYDLLGRVLGTFDNVNSDTFTSKNIAKTQTALLVEVILDNGASKTYKVIF